LSAASSASATWSIVFSLRPRLFHLLLRYQPYLLCRRRRSLSTGARLVPFETPAGIILLLFFETASDWRGVLSSARAPGLHAELQGCLHKPRRAHANLFRRITLSKSIFFFGCSFSRSRRVGISRFSTNEGRGISTRRRISPL
jgi:hypothetical protein